MGSNTGKTDVTIVQHMHFRYELQLYFKTARVKVASPQTIILLRCERSHLSQRRRIIICGEARVKAIY